MTKMQPIPSIAKQAKNALLDEFIEQIDKVRNANKNKTPYGFIHKLVEEAKSVCPWITRHCIMNRMRSRNKASSLLSERTAVANENVGPAQASNADPDRSNGGRPVGATNKKRKMCAMALIATANEIALQYKIEKDSLKRAKKRMKKGRLSELIKETKEKNNLPVDAVITETQIRQRLKRNAPMTEHRAGVTSPLAPVEPRIVSTIIQMARIRMAISPSKGIRLINDLIEGTPVQKDLIEMKKAMGWSNTGTVGLGYWRLFMKRNGHLLVSKRGKKFELDRSSWSTYGNFKQMYECVAEEMEDAGVAVRRSAPVWMNRSGEEVQEADAFGCKVTHDIVCPDYCIVLDEVGGNTNQKGDGNVGGELMLCERGKTPQKKISTKDKHYTVLAPTALTGEVIMCCIIFTGTRPLALCETGLDLLAETVGNVSDIDFFEKNCGPGKRFPGGPTCRFRGKDVPCFC